MTISAEQLSCPPGDDVSPFALWPHTPACEKGPCEVLEVNGNGTRSEQLADNPEWGPVCCYPVTIVDHEDEHPGPTPGRPYYDGGEQRSAPLRRANTQAFAPSSRALAWAQAGAGEHASVAAFSRLVLELMALGAPTALLSEAHQAALDEIGHAETCWAFARELGLSVEAGEFPFLESLRFDGTHATLAAETARDGCIAETLGALLLAAAARAAPEEHVRRALQQIAREEARHAVFSYRVVAWAMARGGDAARAAVEDAFREVRCEIDPQELALRANVRVEILRDALREGITRVIRPAANALLAA